MIRQAHTLDYRHAVGHLSVRGWIGVAVNIVIVFPCWSIGYRRNLTSDKRQPIRRSKCRETGFCGPFELLRMTASTAVRLESHGSIYIVLCSSVAYVQRMYLTHCLLVVYCCCCCWPLFNEVLTVNFAPSAFAGAVTPQVSSLSSTRSVSPVKLSARVIYFIAARRRNRTSLYTVQANSRLLPIAW